MIVISVVALGWGADRLWQHYSPEPTHSPLESALIDSVFLTLSILDHAEVEQHIATLNQNTTLQLTLLDAGNFSGSGVGEKIRSGERVVVHQDHGKQSVYQRIKGSGFALQIDSTQANDTATNYYPTFLFLFYAAIALVIYFWVWPLSRDLKILEKTTQGTSTHHLPKKVDLGRRSTVYPLAAAFNRMVERIEQLLTTQKEMTYAISHELRTPLARMKFALALYESNDKPQNSNVHLVSIATDISEMERLINDLLTYASFDTGGKSVSITLGDLPALTRSLIHTSSKLHSNIKYQINNNLASDMINCDWILIERCIHNLIENASKWAASTVSISLETNHGNVVVCVEDDGVGVAEEFRERIFQSFFRAPASSQADSADSTKLGKDMGIKQNSGFGLGLAIVARIISWHKGSINVTTSSLGGAKFTLAWPN